ncbi:MAG TPA: Xaa-Pro peptidase family protein [Anaerolineales bacterium]
MFLNRHAKLYQALNQAGLDALILNPGPSLVYLTGLHFHLSERPVIAIFIPNAPVVLALPELEAGKTEGLPFKTQVFPYSEDPAGWPAVIGQAMQAAGLLDSNVGIEPRRLRVMELRLLEGAAPHARFIPAEDSLAALRMSKDESEIYNMQRAIDVAQQALLATLPQIRIGMTERELASELTLQLLRSGSEPEFPFSPIVSGGPNGANPHATPSDRPLAQGDLLVIDWGAGVDGYFSDLTRTFAIGEVEPEFKRIAQVVLEANAAGRAATRPGIPAGDIDRAARQVIEQAGYGAAFFHRTGHGLGMEGHEEPYMFAGNPLILTPGMTFTVALGQRPVGGRRMRVGSVWTA